MKKGGGERNLVSSRNNDTIKGRKETLHDWQTLRPIIDYVHDRGRFGLLQKEKESYARFTGIG